MAEEAGSLGRLTLGRGTLRYRLVNRDMVLVDSEALAPSRMKKPMVKLESSGGQGSCAATNLGDVGN